MTPEEHKARHVELHHALDELCVDYFNNTGKLFIETTLVDFVFWSFQQTKNPSNPPSFGAKESETVKETTAQDSSGAG